jgi:hypothetical protein
LTVSTFLFAILAGFFISRLGYRYNHVRDLISSEDAYMLSFYRTSVFLGKTFQNKMREIIDQYYITAYCLELGTYKENKKYIDQIYRALEKVSIKAKSKSGDIFDDLVNYLASIEEVRKKGTVITAEKPSFGHWMSLMTLAAIIVLTIFLIKEQTLFWQITSPLLCTTLVLVILIMRDLQNFRLGGNGLLVESGQEVFEFIGKPRFYHKKYLDEGTVKIPPHVKRYRLGVHEPGKAIKFKIIKVE